MPKPLLIIAYYWPPAGGPGVQRWLKFCKYLPEHGYEVTLVIPENPDYPITDQSLLQEVPEGIQFIKVPILEPSRIMSSLSRKQTKNLQRGIIQKQPGKLERLLLWIRGNLFIPDARVGWKSNVIKATTSYFERHSEVSIITTGPPHSVHLIGLQLKTNHPQVKWLADFRDPWTTIGYHKKLKLRAAAQQKHLVLEQKVLDHCDRLLVTSPHTAGEFRSKTQTPVTVITNGYDVAVNSQMKQPNGKFSLAHVGTLLSDRNPELLWEVLRELQNEMEGFKEDLQLQLAGNISDSVVECIQSKGLTEALEIMGYLSHDDSVGVMYHAQALLLIEIDSEDTKAIIPGKIFEYLASRRPIIAIGPQGADIQEIVGKSQQGAFFNYQEKSKLKVHIQQLYQNYQSGENTAAVGDYMKQYHRKNLTQSLHQTITELWES